MGKDSTPSGGGNIDPCTLVAALCRRRGLAIVISAPSGTGKTTVSSLLMKEMPEITRSVSLTTRPPRETERNGRDYYFVSYEQFQEELKNGRLMEWAEVHGHLYGTPRPFLQERIEQGKDTVLDIDVQGAAAIKSALREAVLIFLLPPSLEELERRLRNRSSDSAKAIEVRLQNALAELERHEFYDYLVVNDDARKAMQIVKSIVISERHRLERLRMD
jgi:guanylate kinase